MYAFSAILICIALCSRKSLAFDDGLFLKLEETKRNSSDFLKECEAAFPYKFQHEVCEPQLLHGLQWILSMRETDYGWKENTHRAIIALALNDWKNLATPMEILQMELQLEIELTKVLFNWNTNSRRSNDLALYVHALIAIGRNPQDFYGINLVGKLLEMANSKPHPFLLLSLCNSNALKLHHVNHIAYALQNRDHGLQSIEYIALAVQAYACALTHPGDFSVNTTLLYKALKSLSILQKEDGCFGNVYTTSMVIQALSTYPPFVDWDQEAAINCLKSTTVELNMMSAYQIELAIHADRIPFIKKLQSNLNTKPPVVLFDLNHYYVQYTVRRNDSAYFTITLKISPNSNFFDIMKLSAELDSKFKFSFYLDKSQQPQIYSISDVVNNPDSNFYWRLCLRHDIDHNRHISNTTTILTSPVSLIPKQGEHVIFWYRDTSCEEI